MAAVGATHPSPAQHHLGSPLPLPHSLVTGREIVSPTYTYIPLSTLIKNVTAIVTHENAKLLLQKGNEG